MRCIPRGGNREGELYVVVHTEAERRGKWCRVSYKVHVLDGQDGFDCECGQFAHMGLLCSHVLKVCICEGRLGLLFDYI